MIRAISLTVVIFLLLGACLLGSAGTLSWPEAWAVLVIYAASKVSALVIADPELMKERLAPGPAGDRVDRVLATLGYLGIYLATFVVAGFDAVRFGPAFLVPQPVKLTALIIFTIGYGISTWAVLCNPFFSIFVRIQKERGHSVISSGPYALIRHPGYAGVLLSHLVLPLALGSLWALLPGIIGIIFFVLRTSREDNTLQEQLDGYREYQARVRWRLIPGVW